MQVVVQEDGFSLYLASGKLLAEHTKDHAFVRIGMEQELMDTYQYPDKADADEQYALSYFKVESEADSWVIYLSNAPTFQEYLRLSYDAKSKNKMILNSNFPRKYFNRYWFRFKSSSDEAFFGGGQRCQQLNIKNYLHALYIDDDLMKSGLRSLPIRMVRHGSFISSKGYALFLGKHERVMLNAVHDEYFELESWGYPQDITWVESESLMDLVMQQSQRMGRNMQIPMWPVRHVIAGFKGPMRRIQANLNYLSSVGLDLGGLWLQDWSRVTFPTFGDSFTWNWFTAPNLREAFAAKVQAFNEHFVHTVVYINGFLTEGSLQFNEADGQDLLINTANNEVYTYPCEEFNLAMVDLSNPEAFEWFVQLIKKQVLDLGIRSWVIDDGSHLPIDGVLYDGKSSYEYQQKWPELLAKASYEAVKLAGLEDEVLILSTSGSLHSSRYVHGVVLAKEFIQISTSWTLKPILVAILSGSMSGFGLQVSIVGNSVGLPASEELLVRHTEIACFTAMLWFQEADRRYQAFHYYKDKSVIYHIHRLMSLFDSLTPYRMALMEEYRERGLPFNRPLFLHETDNPELFQVDDQMFLGEDIMIAPIFYASQRSRRLYIPQGTWHHFSSDLVVEGGQWMELPSKLGQPLAFYRSTSSFSSLFEKAREHFCALINV